MAKPPRRDSERFEAWINEQLDKLFEPTAADIAGEQDHTHSPVFHHELSAQLKRGRVILAVRAKDRAAVERLADTPELSQLALREALRQHRRGREKGERRPRDLSQLTRWCCEEALADVERIRRILKETYPKDYRGSTPLAMEFAARRWGIKDDTLINFKKNRHRYLHH